MDAADKPLAEGALLGAILVRSAGLSLETLQAALAKWVGQFKLSNQVRLSVDIDPQSFL